MTDYFGNNYFGNNYFGFYYFGPEADGGEVVVVVSDSNRNLVIGMGPMGKPSAHPHPLFSRHKH